MLSTSTVSSWKWKELSDDIIRYYKGKIKCRRLTGKTSLGTALYEMLEEGEIYGESCYIYEKFIFPVRLGWRKRK